MVEDFGLDFAWALELDLTVLAPEGAVLRVETQDVFAPARESRAGAIRLDDLVGVAPDRAPLSRSLGELVPPVFRRCELGREDNRFEEDEPRDILGIRRRQVGGGAAPPEEWPAIVTPRSPKAPQKPCRSATRLRQW